MVGAGSHKSEEMMRTSSTREEEEVLHAFFTHSSREPSFCRRALLSLGADILLGCTIATWPRLYLTSSHYVRTNLRVYEAAILSKFSYKI